jgi:hypothetical protein
MSVIRSLFGAVVAVVLLTALPGTAHAGGTSQTFSLNVRSDVGTTLATATGTVTFDAAGLTAGYSVTLCKTGSAYGNTSVGFFPSPGTASGDSGNYGCTSLSGTVTGDGARIGSVYVRLLSGTFAAGGQYRTWTDGVTLIDYY